MKKRDLLRLIESQNRKKGYMNEDFYYKSKGGHSYPEMPEMPEIPEPKRPNWEPEEPNWEPEEPNWNPEEPEEPELDEDIDMLRPRNKMSRLSRRMNGPAIIPIRIDPDRKREREREIEPDEWQPDEYEPENPDEDEETKIQGKRNMNGPAIIPIRIDPDRKREREIEPDEWQPDEYEPENPDEDEETKIQGKRNMEFMLEIRNKFNRTMNRLNQTHYKPIKYNKY